MNIWESYQSNIFKEIHGKVKGHDVFYYQEPTFRKISKVFEIGTPETPENRWFEVIKKNLNKWSTVYVNAFIVYIYI